MAESTMCERCGSPTIAIKQSCLCDKDFCLGQRCGADEITKYYKCLKCDWTSGVTSESKNYMNYHCR